MKYRIKKQDGFTLYRNENGVEKGTAENQVIVEDGYVFKDLAKTGTFRRTFSGNVWGKRL